jgi:PadR family transcriptional regulator, regulatory protein PadR
MLGIRSYMGLPTENWKTQIRKGYLELCILLLIRNHGRLYGFDILERLSALELDVKEGTLYPLLNRMTVDGPLSSQWETESAKGHPRKFYSLNAAGQRLLSEMGAEFDRMLKIYSSLAKEKGNA